MTLLGTTKIRSHDTRLSKTSWTRQKLVSRAPVECLRSHGKHDSSTEQTVPTNNSSSSWAAPNRKARFVASKNSTVASWAPTARLNNEAHEAPGAALHSTTHPIQTWSRTRAKPRKRRTQMLWPQRERESQTERERERDRYKSHEHNPISTLYRIHTTQARAHANRHTHTSAQTYHRRATHASSTYAHTHTP